MSDERQIDVTPQTGMDLRGLAKDASGAIRGADFIQNVIPRPLELTVRPGFGLVRQYGTTLNAGRVTANLAANRITYGLGPCIGATHVRTAWNTDQILAIHPLFSFTGNLRVNVSATPAVDVYGRRATFLRGVVAHIHDLNSGRHLEVVLHEQDTQDDDLSVVFPNYGTRFDVDRSRWARPLYEPRWALFSPMRSAASSAEQFNVVVTIDGMGQWTYRPVDAPFAPIRQNNSLDCAVLYPVMGEQACFSPLNLARGIEPSADGFEYFKAGEIGQVTAQCVFNGDRIVYGASNTMYFASPVMPQAILVDDAYTLPAPDNITLLAPVRGLVFVATAGARCWVYQPSLQGNQDAGALTVISPAVGCVSERASCLGLDGVFFVGDAGVYYYAGGLALEWLSEPVDRLWSDPQSLQMPLTDFYAQQGITGVGATQLPARIDVRRQMQTARLCWDDERKTLHCVCDDVVLSWTRGFGWSVWLFQTHAGDAAHAAASSREGATAVYGGAANIASPTLVPVRDALYLLGGPETHVYDEPGSSELEDCVTDASCYLLRLGRGGAIDRSMSATPAKFDAYTFVLSGYVQPGCLASIAVGANAYAYRVQDGDDFTTIYRAIAAAAVADPAYNVLYREDLLYAVRKTAGVSVTVVAASITVSGTFTATRVQTGAAAVVLDADLEDERTPIGGWVKFNAGSGADGSGFWLGQHVVLPAGYGPPESVSAETVQTYWFPVGFGGPAANRSAYHLWFTFDNARWQPILSATGVPTVMAFVCPSERLGSEAGYARGAPANLFRQVQVYQAGAPNAAGNEIRIDWDGAFAGWTTTPQLNLGSIGPDTLIWLGFRYLGENPAVAGYPVTSLWLDPTFTAFSMGSPAGQVNQDVYVWQSGRYAANQAALAAKQQPVDWAVKTRQFEAGGDQLRCSGLFLTAQHQGDGTDDVVPVWRYGPLNTATSSDWRDYAAQALDFTSVPPGNSEQNQIGPYPRLQPANQGADPVANVYGGSGVWGDLTAPTTQPGNVLIGDAQVDTLATTDGTQGSRLSVLVHGTMNAPGEAVRLGKIGAVLRKMGFGRRWH